jgi:hypothetical protein
VDRAARGRREPARIVLMRVASQLRPAVARVRVVALCGLCACNAVLGIHEPADRELDGGVHAADTGAHADVGGGDAFDAGAPVRPTWARWPMPNPGDEDVDNEQSYDIDDAGLVTDRITRLIWQQPIDPRPRTLRQAEMYCEQLDLAGHTYRLPTRLELLSLIDFTRADPSIDLHAFGDAPASYFWSSSRLPNRAWLAWVVNFGTGPGFVSSSETDSVYPVRCVAADGDNDDDGSKPVTHFAFDDGVVTDVGTRLTWQQPAPEETYAWDAAATYCETLELTGGGWRLPTIKELLTLVDEQRTNPAMDGRAFPAATVEYVWSSSRVAGEKSAAWAVGFRFGFDASLETETEQHVRCVRNGS